MVTTVADESFDRVRQVAPIRIPCIKHDRAPLELRAKRHLDQFCRFVALTFATNTQHTDTQTKCDICRNMVVSSNAVSAGLRCCLNTKIKKKTIEPRAVGESWT